MSLVLEVVDFYHKASGSFSYIAWHKISRDCVIIDPVLDYDAASGTISHQFVSELFDYILEQKLAPHCILETHAHADHLSGAQYLKQKLNIPLMIGQGIKQVQSHFKQQLNLEPSFDCEGNQFDRLLNDGDQISAGKLDVMVMATPGHTSDSMTYLIEDAAFIGDTLFYPDLGTARCDFPGGDAKILYESVQKLFSLPAHTRLFLCHDYPQGREHVAMTLVQQQQLENNHIKQGVSEADYIELRQARDKTLATPQLLYPAIQVNIRAGKMPLKETNGTRYIKVPLKNNLD
jgi:glyoxylase-like metal-dependent hydrolase (beta-lactamase superfamily II)